MTGELPGPTKQTQPQDIVRCLPIVTLKQGCGGSFRTLAGEVTYPFRESFTEGLSGQPGKLVREQKGRVR